MEALYSVKILAWSFHLIHMFSGPRVQKCVFLKIGLNVCMRVYVYICEEYPVFYTSKTNKNRSIQYFLVLAKIKKPEMGSEKMEMRPKISISKTVLAIFFKLDA